MRRLFCVLCLIALITGCGFNPNLEIESNPVILEYLPESADTFDGDGGYQHVIKQIEKISGGQGDGVKIIGEVKDILPPGKYENHAFSVELRVDENQMVQSYSGKRLNESEFLKLVLIKLPFEVGNTWKFNSKTRTGEHVSVLGEILEYDEAMGMIKVRHSLKNGYYEERTLYKSRGVTDFVRLVTFKNETAISGYHSVWRFDALDTSNTEVAMAYPKQVVIPDPLYNLLLGFNQSWSAYILNEDEKILSFIEVESEAYKKIMAVDRELSTAITFIKYYPYAVEFNNDQATIWAFERFEDQEGLTLENKVKYNIVHVDLIPKISNFEIVK